MGKAALPQRTGLPIQRPVSLSSDRRLSARVAAHLPVELRMRGMPPLRARTRDIGIGGACVQTRSMIPIESVEGVRIIFPEREVSLRVEPCWHSELSNSEGPLTGLRFTDLSDDDRTCIWEFAQARGRDIAGFLRESPDLEGLGFDDSFELALYTRLREVPHANAVYRQGVIDATSASVYLVYRGSVLLEASVQTNERVQIETMGTGRIFGGLPTFSGHVSVDSAIATVASTLLEFDRYTIAYLERAKPLLAEVLREAVIRASARRFGELVGRYAAARKVSRSRATGEPI